MQVSLCRLPLMYLGKLLLVHAVAHPSWLFQVTWSLPEVSASPWTFAHTTLVTT